MIPIYLMSGACLLIAVLILSIGVRKKWVLSQFIRDVKNKYRKHDGKQLTRDEAKLVLSIESPRLRANWMRNYICPCGTTGKKYKHHCWNK